MRKKFIKSGVTAILVTASIAAAHANIVEFADPCVKARREYHAQRSALQGAVNAAVTEAGQIASVPPEVKTEMWAHVTKDLRHHFEQNVMPQMRQAGIEVTDEHFNKWMEAQIAADGGRETIESTMFLDEYRKNTIADINMDREDAERAMRMNKASLDGECRMDGGNTMLRVGVRAATAPIALFGRTLERSKNEKTAFGKVLAIGTLGASWDAIRKHGVGGGKNSEVRKAARAIAKVFGW